jgi:hypothetical protein
MNPSLKAIAVTLLTGVTTMWMAACSRDVPTEPTYEPYHGAPQAQIPANDDFGDATEITALPFIDNLNTSEATTEPDEPADPNDPAVCFIGGHTVWYKFTPSQNMRINANTFGSDYDTGIAVFTGSTIDALSLVLCNDDAVTGQFVQSNVNFDAVAGTSYYFMVGSCCGSDGGNLVFRVDVSPELGLTIDPTGSVNAATGEVTISGTITCAEPVSGTLDGFIRQRFGRVFLTGGFFTFFECDGVTSWQVQVVGDNGLFAGGRVEVTANAFAFDRDFIRDSTTVRLSGKGR